MGQINNKDPLSPAEAGRWSELGNYYKALILLDSYLPEVDISCLWLFYNTPTCLPLALYLNSSEAFSLFRLYYEFTNYATIGFGEMLPEDEITVAGAILKNILVKIPAAIILLTLYLRLLPLIS